MSPLAARTPKRILFDVEGEAQPWPPPDEGTFTVDAFVVEATADGHVRLRMEDGDERRLPAPEEMLELVRPGLRVILYHDSNRELLGWFIPEHGLGQDLRE